MTAWDRLRASALDTLAESLPQQGLQPDEQSLVIDTLSGVDFPAFLAFLGTQDEDHEQARHDQRSPEERSRLTRSAVVSPATMDSRPSTATAPGRFGTTRESTSKPV